VDLPSQSVPRTLALDIGDRRIGVAISDPLGYTAQPLVTIHRKNLPADLKSIARLVRKHEVAAIVIGNPLHMSGEPSPQAIRTQSFAEALRAQHPGMPIHLLDERLTTAQAHHLLDQSGHARRNASTRRERSAIVDQVAAVLILEAFLSGGTPQLLPDPHSGI
jgi:putative Holliday junction resolvase